MAESSGRRPRSKNFTHADRQTLSEIVSRYANELANKSRDKHENLRKERIWKTIAIEYRYKTNQLDRTIQQLKNAYYIYKRTSSSSQQMDNAQVVQCHNSQTLRNQPEQGNSSSINDLAASTSSVDQSNEYQVNPDEIHLSNQPSMQINEDPVPGDETPVPTVVHSLYSSAAQYTFSNNNDSEEGIDQSEEPGEQSLRHTNEGAVSQELHVSPPLEPRSEEHSSTQRPTPHTPPSPTASQHRHSSRSPSLSPIRRPQRRSVRSIEVAEDRSRQNATRRRRRESLRSRSNPPIQRPARRSARSIQRAEDRARQSTRARMREKLENAKNETFKVLRKTAKSLEKNNKQQHELRMKILKAELEAQKAAKTAADKSAETMTIQQQVYQAKLANMRRNNPDNI